MSKKVKVPKYVYDSFEEMKFDVMDEDEFKVHAILTVESMFNNQGLYNPTYF
ncbi:hypothetical protein NBRC111893_2397 [Lentilactobacillus kosonis]|uniref:Uncharacterized protein n=1 Tax=Lentilactobacillus kosonis TaxID=2810561 RepID=A0A401FPW8_9LACO|nr:hypothetical protein NBRC111893_2397 [Lentilactobacillus kosonis]